MVLSTKRCPYCGAVIPFLRPKKRRLYGSALRKCPQCDKAYIDTAYTEMALSGTTRADNRWFNPVWPVAICMGAAVVVLALLGVAGESVKNIMLVFGGILTAAPLIALIFEVATYGSRKRALEQELKESEARLQNPRYAKMLRDAGYHIPVKYLQPEKPSGAKTAARASVELRQEAGPQPLARNIGKH